MLSAFFNISSAFFSISSVIHYTLKTLFSLITQENPMWSSWQELAGLLEVQWPCSSQWEGAGGINILPALLPFSSKLCLPRKRAPSALWVSRWLHKTPRFYIKEGWILKPFVCLCVWQCSRSCIFKKQGGRGSFQNVNVLKAYRNYRNL